MFDHALLVFVVMIVVFQAYKFYRVFQYGRGGAARARLSLRLAEECFPDSRLWDSHLVWRKLNAPAPLDLPNELRPSIQTSHYRTPARTFSGGYNEVLCCCILSSILRVRRLRSVTADRAHLYVLIVSSIM